MPPLTSTELLCQVTGGYRNQLEQQVVVGPQHPAYTKVQVNLSFRHVDLV